MGRGVCGRFRWARWSEVLVSLGSNVINFIQPLNGKCVKYMQCHLQEEKSGVLHRMFVASSESSESNIEHRPCAQNRTHLFFQLRGTMWTTHDIMQHAQGLQNTCTTCFTKKRRSWIQCRYVQIGFARSGVKNARFLKCPS